MLFYPSLVFLEDRRSAGHETRFAPEVLNQLENLQRRLRTAQERSTAARPSCVRRLGAARRRDRRPPESAFLIWQGTALERYRVSSAVELYNGRSGWSAGLP